MQPPPVPDPHDPSSQQPDDPSPMNPFAEDPAEEPATNPYAAPQAAGPPPPYYSGLPNRSGLVLGLGLGGIAVAGALLFCCMPLMLAALGLTIPAWMLGRQDLREIDQGMMDPAGRSFTQVGYILGIIGTLGILGFLLLMAIAIVVTFALPAVSN